MKKTWAVILVVIIFYGYLAGCVPAKRSQLQLSLRAGDSYALRVTVEQKITQAIQRQRQDTHQIIGIGYTFDVVETDGFAAALVKVTYHSVLFRQETQGKKVEYDSADFSGSVPEGAEAFAALVGEKFLMSISKTGEVLSISGSEKITAKLARVFDLSDEYFRAFMLQSLKNQFSKEALKETMQKLFVAYSDKSVGINDKWQKTFLSKKDFPLNIDTTYRLKAYKKGVIFIEEHSKIKSKQQTALPEQSGFLSVRYNLSGVQQGVLEVDEGTGWLRRARFSQGLSGTVSNFIVSKAQSYPVSIAANITIEPFERYPVIEK